MGSIMIAGGIFFLLTQGLSVNTLLPIVSGTGMFGIPIVKDLLGRTGVGGKSEKSPVPV